MWTALVSLVLGLWKLITGRKEADGVALGKASQTSADEALAMRQQTAEANAAANAPQSRADLDKTLSEHNL